jgi:DNA-binding CsgD family transcriptional regulator
MQVRDYERLVAQAATSEALWSAFADYFRGTEVDRISYLHLPPLGAPDANRPLIAADGFPDELVAEYFEERLFRDNPALAQAHRGVEPIYWDEFATLHPLNDREAAFLAKFSTAELGYGVGIHTFGPNGRGGQCGLGFRPGYRRLTPARLAEFQWVCQLGHLRYCDILVPTLGPEPNLSHRETEILAWAARGKSNDTIGEILGISAHTVNAHMRRIYLKLGVFDRISAAIRGIGSGLIRAET